MKVWGFLVLERQLAGQITVCTPRLSFRHRKGAEQQIKCIKANHRSATNFERPVYANTANFIANELIEVVESNGANGNKYKQ
jgi:hypothetical protein